MWFYPVQQFRNKTRGGGAGRTHRQHRASTAGIAVPPVTAYPLVLLAHECGDTEERADLEAALPAADEHFGVPGDELALVCALLELLAMVWHEVTEWARCFRVPAQGLEVREHVVRPSLAADGHKPRDAAVCILRKKQSL